MGELRWRDGGGGSGDVMVVEKLLSCDGGGEIVGMGGRGCGNGDVGGEALE